MFEKTREFTWRHKRKSVCYSNATPDDALGSFKRRSKPDATLSVCRTCHLVHAVNQRECE